jgi:hypothetical protein
MSPTSKRPALRKNRARPPTEQPEAAAPNTFAGGPAIIRPCPLVGTRRGMVCLVALLPVFAILNEGRSLRAAETVAAWPGLAVPSAEKLRSMPVRPHPRLILGLERVDEMKRQIAAGGRLRAWHRELRERADKYLADALPAYIVEKTDRYSRTLLSMSRRTLERVQTLALLYHLDGDAKYAERVWRELETAAGFVDWNPIHFLDTAEMTHAFATGYDWLYAYWTEERRAFLRRAIIEKGLRPALAGYQQAAGWTKRVNNWNQVTSGGIAIGALALLDVEPKLASELLHQALRRLPTALAQYGSDGGWVEGVYYWHVGTRYSVYAIAALETALGTDFGLSHATGLAGTGWFPIHLTSPAGAAFNFADSYPNEFRAAHLFWLARRFNEPAFAQFQRAAADSAANDLVRFDPGPFFSRALTEARTALDLVWYDPACEALPEPGQWPLDQLFAEARVGSMRSRWHDPDAAFVAFKGGSNRDSHNHLDLGSFVFDALGVRWAIDIGRIDYYPPGAFGGGLRWGYYNMRAEGHNTVVIDPREEADQHPDAIASILRFEAQPAEAFAIIDLTSTAYPGKVRRLHRGIALTANRSQLLVQDELEADRPVDAWWFMHTRAEIQISDDGATATLKQDGRTLKARLHTPRHAARFVIMAPKPLHPSPKIIHQMHPDGVRKLAVRAEGVTALQLAITLVPETAASANQRPAEFIPLRNWGGTTR